jgi:tetratricopeptide (TPR) repeat protein
MQDGLITIPVLNDAKKMVYRRYGVFMLPLAIIADAEGRLQSVIPYTANINEIIDNNLKLLLGDWTLKQFKNSLTTPTNFSKTKEEKAYIRRVNYGRVMSARHMYSAALREFNTARKIMPQATEALIGIGQVQLELKKWEKSAKSFKEALAIDKESDQALAGLGLALYKGGDEERALPILENALISENQDLEVIVSLAEIYEKKGNIAKAIRLNKLAITLLQNRFK